MECLCSFCVVFSLCKKLEMTEDMGESGWGVFAGQFSVSFLSVLF